MKTKKTALLNLILFCFCLLFCFGEREARAIEKGNFPLQGSSDAGTSVDDLAEEAILGGRSTTTEPIASAMVKLQNGCSGILIAEKIVLTAAHCISERQHANPETPGILWISVSPWIKHFSRGESLACRNALAEKLIFPPNQEKSSATDTSNNSRVSYDPDIAIIVLGEKLCGKPAKLPLKGQPIPPFLKVGGFGVGNDSRDIPSVINVKLKQYELEELASKLGWNTKRPPIMKRLEKILSQYMTFITNGSESICAGDSGGPVFAETGGRVMLWGISSGAEIPVEVQPGTNRCIPSGSVPVFVPVNQHLDWISETINKN